MLPPRQNFHIIAAYEGSSQNWRQINPFFPASKPQRMSSDCYISFCMICESLSKEWTKRHYVTFLIYFWARDSYCTRVRVTLTLAGFTWKWNWHQCNSHLLKTRVFYCHNLSFSCFMITQGFLCQVSEVRIILCAIYRKFSDDHWKTFMSPF